MILDGATVKSNFNRFVKRVIEKQVVFYLSNENGVANSVSNDGEETPILMFWSDRAYARRAKHIFNENFEETEMDLFYFLYQWLPGMSGDGVLAGPNWNGNLVGTEIDAFELRTIIEDAMPQTLIDQHISKCDKMLKKSK